jgi:MYXO-CTERM domain-containing protein
MKRAIFASVLATALGVVPALALAQTDQTTTAPMATATANPVGATVNPMETAAPVVNTYPASSGGGNSGWWGLIGLIGLLGLFGTRRDHTTTIE